MHRCGSLNDMAGLGSCSCGLFHHAQPCPFSVLFPDLYLYQYSSSHYSSGSSSADCTLLLGTPSTRLIQDDRRVLGTSDKERSSIPNFCRDILQMTEQLAPTTSAAPSKAAGNSGVDGRGEDPLLAPRRCTNCHTTSTPLWRSGPRGPKPLCNACGIRFKKEERRVTAVAAAAQPMFSHGQYVRRLAGSSRVCQSHHQKLPCFGTDFRVIEDDARDDSDNSVSFISWRLNVSDRASCLVHDFTIL